MTLDLENELNLKGFINVGGIDEAGRGPLAGPVCAACVILDKNNIPEGINDSKKLSEKKRNHNKENSHLCDLMIQHLLMYAVIVRQV